MEIDSTQAVTLEWDSDREIESPSRSKLIGTLKVYKKDSSIPQSFQIFSGENTIGRSPGCNVHIDNKALSKRHAVIEASPTSCCIYDDDSLNKTRKRKKKLKPQVRYNLEDGEEIYFGNVRARFHTVATEADESSDSDSLIPVQKVQANKTTEANEKLLPSFSWSNGAISSDDDTDIENSTLSLMLKAKAQQACESKEDKVLAESKEPVLGRGNCQPETISATCSKASETNPISDVQETTQTCGGAIESVKKSVHDSDTSLKGDGVDTDATGSIDLNAPTQRYAGSEAETDKEVDFDAPTQPYDLGEDEIVSVKPKTDSGGISNAFDKAETVPYDNSDQFSDFDIPTQALSGAACVNNSEICGANISTVESVKVSGTVKMPSSENSSFDEVVKLFDRLEQIKNELSASKVNVGSSSSTVEASLEPLKRQALHQTTEKQCIISSENNAKDIEVTQVHLNAATQPYDGSPKNEIPTEENSIDLLAPTLPYSNFVDDELLADEASVDLNAPTVPYDNSDDEDRPADVDLCAPTVPYSNSAEEEEETEGRGSVDLFAPTQPYSNSTEDEPSVGQTGVDVFTSTLPYSNSTEDEVLVSKPSIDLAVSTHNPQVVDLRIVQGANACDPTVPFQSTADDSTLSVDCCDKVDHSTPEPICIDAGISNVATVPLELQDAERSQGTRSSEIKLNRSLCGKEGESSRDSVSRVSEVNVRTSLSSLDKTRFTTTSHFQSIFVASDDSTIANDSLICPASQEISSIDNNRKESRMDVNDAVLQVPETPCFAAVDLTTSAQSTPETNAVDNRNKRRRNMRDTSQQVLESPRLRNRSSAYKDITISAQPSPETNAINDGDNRSKVNNTTLQVLPGLRKRRSAINDITVAAQSLEETDSVNNGNKNKRRTKVAKTFLQVVETPVLERRRSTVKDIMVSDKSLQEASNSNVYKLITRRSARESSVKAKAENLGGRSSAIEDITSSDQSLQEASNSSSGKSRTRHSAREISVKGKASCSGGLVESKPEDGDRETVLEEPPKTNTKRSTRESSKKATVKSSNRKSCSVESEDLPGDIRQSKRLKRSARTGEGLEEVEESSSTIHSDQKSFSMESENLPGELRQSKTLKGNAGKKNGLKGVEESPQTSQLQADPIPGPSSRKDVTSGPRKSATKRSSTVDEAPGMTRRSKRVSDAETRNDDSVSSSAKSQRRQQKINIMFTGITDEKKLKLIAKSLGAEVTEDVRKCTHLITDKFHRTVKFLCCVAKGVSIINTKWLRDSYSKNAFLDVDAYLLDDAAAEEQHGFRLAQTLQKSGAQPLLSGWTLTSTVSVQPNAAQLKEIVECAGGKYAARIPKSPNEKFIIVGHPSDRETWTKHAQRGFGVVNAEFLLTGLLQYKLDAKKYEMQ